MSPFKTQTAETVDRRGFLKTGAAVATAAAAGSGSGAAGESSPDQEPMIELRNACVAKAHELGMGIAAMKVVGGGTLGAWSGYVVPEFDNKRLAQLPAAAIRYVLDDERIQLLVIGMRLEREIDANIRTLAGDVTYTVDDRSLLAEFCAKAYDSDAIKRMRVD